MVAAEGATEGPLDQLVECEYFTIFTFPLISSSSHQICSSSHTFRIGLGGEKFDGLIMLDESHKAKTIELDGDGNAINVGKVKTCSKTAAAVVTLQNLLPRARVVYCSATSVSEPQNLASMPRLGLWGPGTEYPHFTDFLTGLKQMGTGAMEVSFVCSL